MWEDSYASTYSTLKRLYYESDEYFSNICKPIAKKLHLYDIFGADLVDGEYCGNTILCSYFVPDYSYNNLEGEVIKRRAIIGGKYISLFDACQMYTVKNSMTFSTEDYGGFFKSPVGNEFSDKFVLFSLLCQVNFVLKCVDEYIIDETPTKLRFSYLLYYYIARILPEINNKLSSGFHIDEKWVDSKFRNTMAHYKIGVALRENEIITDDPMYGLTQKFFGCDYATIKETILHSLESHSKE